MKYSQIYNKAADFVEKGWTQGRMAVDKHGNDCHSQSKDAVRWCLSGALSLTCVVKSFSQFSMSPRTELVKYLSLEDSITYWNDDPNRTQEDVVELLREAAKRADEEGMTIG